MPEELQSVSLDNNANSNPLVFISHDTRDAEIAEAFSRLLSSVSAGVLKSFRSSDKKGRQGIEYGVEWYPEVMSKLEIASDVVCLLTTHSVNRPWILYEAGVAKGKLGTPVHGVALGIPLNEASTGPFAQFQNCDDEDESLTSLVMQLVGRIPNAEPDRDVVLMQVQTFKKAVNKMQTEQGQSKQKTSKQVDGTSVAKLFEEVKVMFQELPSRIEGSVCQSMDAPSSRRKFLRFHPAMLEELMYMNAKEGQPFLGLMIVCGMLKNEFPWLYDIAVQMYVASENDESDRLEKLQKTFAASIKMTRHPILENMVDSDELHFILRRLPMFFEKLSPRSTGVIRRRARVVVEEPIPKL